MLGMDTLGAFLLALYRLEKERPMEAFQNEALNRLRNLVPFDSAWWGMAAMDGADIRLHCSHVFQLPQDFPAQWYAIREHDAIAWQAYQNPGTTVHFSHERLVSAPPLAAVTDRHGIREVLTTVIIRPALGLLTFLSLYRGRNPAAFSETERVFVENAMPHLAAAWNGNWLVSMERFSASGAGERPAVAVADSRGVLHVAESRFPELMATEWRHWRGPRLPAELRTLLVEDGNEWQGDALVANTSPRGELHIVTVRPRSLTDRLTPRELATARAYANGGTYKEVAASLALSPATVRHYLRNAYTKLDVCDKAQLSKLLAREAAVQQGER